MGLLTGRAGLGLAGLSLAGLGWACSVYLNPLFYELVVFLMMKQLHLKANSCKEAQQTGQTSCYKTLPTLAVYGKERPTSARSDRGWGSAGVDGSVGVEVNQEGWSAVWDICLILK